MPNVIKVFPAGIERLHAMETAAILVHSLNKFSLCTKMAILAVAKLLLCCNIICKRSMAMWGGICSPYMHFPPLLFRLLVAIIPFLNHQLEECSSTDANCCSCPAVAPVLLLLLSCPSHCSSSLVANSHDTIL